VGEYLGSNRAFGRNVDGAGVIAGHFRRWGYAEFKTEDVEGKGLGFTIFEKGTLTANYMGPGSMSLMSFAGPGNSISFGADMANVGKFQGFASDGQTLLWQGEFSGFSFGIPGMTVSGGNINTKTYLLFPYPIH
jgi:hypothetical protein